MFESDEEEVVQHSRRPKVVDGQVEPARLCLPDSAATRREQRQQQLVLQRKLRDPSRPLAVASLAPAARLSLTKQRQLVRLRKLRLLLEHSPPATDQWRRLAASA